ncbi:hypothetical protein IW141_001688 [Coemansia sp. RSA 355]|nr:hypothetical protein IW141_001688 [Coemansia sp. RSA 355]
MNVELNPAPASNVQVRVIEPSDTEEAVPELSKDVEAELAKAAATMLGLSLKSKMQARRTRSSSVGQYCDRCSQKLSDLEFPYHASRCVANSTCDFECSSADLYFDHLLFDTRHFEMAKQAQEEEHKSKESRRSRSLKRTSLLVIAN